MWTLQDVQDYCEHFNCYGEIDADRGMIFFYYNDGSAVGAAIELHLREGE